MMASSAVGDAGTSAANDIDLRVVVRSVRQSLVPAALCVLAFLGLASLYLHTTTPVYTTSMTVAPVQGGGTGASGLKGLASLAGIDLAQGGQENTLDLYVGGFHTLAAAQRLTADPAVLRGAFPDDWNESAARWEEPAGFVRGLAKMVRSLLMPAEEWKAPDAARLHEYLQDNVKVTQSQTSSLITIALEHPDPQFARSLILTLHRIVDADVKARTRARTSAYIVHISGLLARVTIGEHRDALADLLSEQEKQRMLASAALPYAAEPFDLPVTDRRPTRPKPGLVIVVAAMLGLLTGFAIGIYRQRRSGIGDRQLSQG